MCWVFKAFLPVCEALVPRDIKILLEKGGCGQENLENIGLKTFFQQMYLLLNV